MNARGGTVGGEARIISEPGNHMYEMMREDLL